MNLSGGKDDDEMAFERSLHPFDIGVNSCDRSTMAESIVLHFYRSISYCSSWLMVEKIITCASD